jgi:hypothetical protein
MNRHKDVERVLPHTYIPPNPAGIVGVALDPLDRKLWQRRSWRPDRSDRRALVEPPSREGKMRRCVSPSLPSASLSASLGHAVTIPCAETSVDPARFLFADIIRPLLWQEELPASFSAILNLRNTPYEGD